MFRRKVTLALGGGGARGLAHLGVIEVLVKAGYEIERIVGISIGSLAGAMYAFEPNIKKLQSKAMTYLSSSRFEAHQKTLHGDRPASSEGSLFSWYQQIKNYLRGHQIFRRVVTRSSMLPGLVLQEIVLELLPEEDIQQAKIPLSIVAMDLRGGHRIVLEQGSVQDAVQASSAIPGIFPPVELGDFQLCDIGVICSLPLIVAQHYQPTCLITVDVSSGLNPILGCETAIDVLMRVDEIGEHLFRQQIRSEGDFLIHPQVQDVEWSDFSSAHQMIVAGRKATDAMLSRLEEWWKQKERQ